MTNMELLAFIISMGGFVISIAMASSAKGQAESAKTQADAAVTQAEAANSQGLLAEKQLKDLLKKVGMVTDPSKMFEVMPVWYMDRMGKDYWGFGLLLTSANILAISRIEGVSSDGKWMEVSMLEKGSGPDTIGGTPVTYAPTDRVSASVRIESVQTAFEIWTS